MPSENDHRAARERMEKRYRDSGMKPGAARERAQKVQDRVINKQREKAGN